MAARYVRIGQYPDYRDEVRGTLAEILASTANPGTYAAPEDVAGCTLEMGADGKWVGTLGSLPKAAADALYASGALANLATGTTCRDTSGVSYSYSAGVGWVGGVDLTKDPFISLQSVPDLITSGNLLDWTDPEVMHGYYQVETDGAPTVNANYSISAFIPVSPGIPLIFGNDGLGAQPVARVVWGYDKNKAIIPASFASSVSTYIPKVGCYYLRISVHQVIYPKSQMVVGTTLPPYSAFAPISVNKNLVRGLLVAQSTQGFQGATTTQPTIADGGSLQLNDFPQNLKNGKSVSFTGKFSSFLGSVSVGMGGAGIYRSDWIEVNSTQVVRHHFDGTETFNGVNHNLTISQFISIAMTIEPTGICRIAVETLSGSFSTTFDFGHEANGIPFASTSGQAVTSAKLSAMSAILRKTIWVFGDSYVGISPNRWPGPLNEFGYLNFLINGVAGQSSAGAYAELLRCIKYGAPKYLCWFLGMNDSDSDYTTQLALVRSFCKNYGIQLILGTVPTVPSRYKENINTAVRATMLRYVDFASAVGADAAGNWYAGFLETPTSTGVHPTALGASALAMRLLVDVPEIMANS